MNKTEHEIARGDLWKPHYRPTNGSGGEAFYIGPMGCHSCTVDHDYGWHHEAGHEKGGCNILDRALWDENGAREWQQRETGEVRCIGWNGPCSCTDPRYVEPTAVYFEGLR